MMGEAARRRRLMRVSEQMHEQGQGVWEINIVPAVDVVNFLDTHDDRWAFVIVDALRLFEHKRPPFLCLLCDTEIRKPVEAFALSIVTPKHNDPEHAIVSPICRPCYVKPEPQARIVAYLKANWLTDLRIIAINKEGGTA